MIAIWSAFCAFPVLQPRRSIFLGRHSLLAGIHFLQVILPPSSGMALPSGFLAAYPSSYLPTHLFRSPSTYAPIPRPCLIRLSRIVYSFHYRIRGSRACSSIPGTSDLQSSYSFYLLALPVHALDRVLCFDLLPLRSSGSALPLRRYSRPSQLLLLLLIFLFL